MAAFIRCRRLSAGFALHGFGEDGADASSLLFRDGRSITAGFEAGLKVLQILGGDGHDRCDERDGHAAGVFAELHGISADSVVEFLDVVDGVLYGDFLFHGDVKIAIRSEINKNRGYFTAAPGMS